MGTALNSLREALARARDQAAIGAAVGDFVAELGGGRFLVGWTRVATLVAAGTDCWEALGSLSPPPDIAARCTAANAPWRVSTPPGGLAVPAHGSGARLTFLVLEPPAADTNPDTLFLAAHALACQATWKTGPPAT